MIIKGQQANQKIVGPMKISEYKINSDFSGSLIEIDGDHGEMKNINEDRIYFVVGGEGKFTIEDNARNVETNDLIFIPKNTPYNITGKMKYFLICSPQFNSDNDVFL